MSFSIIVLCLSKMTTKCISFLENMFIWQIGLKFRHSNDVINTRDRIKLQRFAQRLWGIYMLTEEKEFLMRFKRHVHTLVERCGAVVKRRTRDR